MGTVAPFYGGQKYYPVEPVGPYKPPPAVTSPPPGGGDGTTPPPYTPPPFTNGPPDTIPEQPPTDPGRGPRPAPNPVVPNPNVPPPPYRANPPGRHDSFEQPVRTGTPTPPALSHPGRRDTIPEQPPEPGYSPNPRRPIAAFNNGVTPESVKDQAIARMQAIQNYGNMNATPLGGQQVGFQPGGLPNLEAVDALRNIARRYL